MLDGWDMGAYLLFLHKWVALCRLRFRRISDCDVAVDSGSCWIHLLHHLLSDQVSVPVCFKLLRFLWIVLRWAF